MRSCSYHTYSSFLSCSRTNATNQNSTKRNPSLECRVSSSCVTISWHVASPQGHTVNVLITPCHFVSLCLFLLSLSFPVVPSLFHWLICSYILLFCSHKFLPYFLPFLPPFWYFPRSHLQYSFNSIYLLCSYPSFTTNRVRLIRLTRNR